MSNSLSPTLFPARNSQQNAAIIFVHGFQGDKQETWESFIPLILEDPTLKNWDVYSAGYSSRLTIDFGVWDDDADLSILAIGLATLTRNSPLSDYKALALVAHSMGGLVVQKAIVENNDLKIRTTHVVNYGTPSGGTKKAFIGRLFNKQSRDMYAGSNFLIDLRAKWKDQIETELPFTFAAIAGENDAFIPPESSLGPFPNEQKSVVPGDHLGIVRPDSVNNPSYSVLHGILSNTRGRRSGTESARLAVEQKDFEKAIDLLLPGADGLDANSIVTLALALESVGRQDEALAVIGNWNQQNPGKSIDALGALAGRLKRRWLVARQQKDCDDALEMYSKGLALAETQGDSAQAYYHAINIAYLQLATAPPGSGTPQAVIDMANKALQHATSAPESRWSLATIGEASLLLGNLFAAIEAYGRAKQQARNLREIDSMRSQAMSVANMLMDENAVRAIHDIFGD